MTADDDATHDCTIEGAHVHPMYGVFVMRAFVVVDEFTWRAVCPDPVSAARIAELLTRHGMADIPDSAAELES